MAKMEATALLGLAVAGHLLASAAPDNVVRPSAATLCELPTKGK
jgi:hypothetical protein